MPFALPTPNDYQQVLQNPRIFLGDNRLKICNIEKDPRGMPKVRSGGFALTYRLENGNQKWALRCFHKAVTERERMYTAICRYISTHRSDILVPVEYINQGVLVKGSWYPITIMDWVEGDTLNNFLYKNINNPSLVVSLGAVFVHVTDELERLNIAHGDLSQLNILICNGKMILVDYDGMFVPELAGKKSTELGNPHFQHPRRSADDFNPTLDRFSEIVIYLTLKGLALNPRLYQDFGKGGEGLIFKRDDFINPFNSRLLAALEKFLELNDLIRQFRTICVGDISDVPKLGDFLEKLPIVIRPSTIPASLPSLTNQFLPLNATNRGTLLENEGEYITVIGQITNLREAISRRNEPYALFNFGNYKQHCFTVVLWSEALGLLTKSGKKPGDYYNQWVAVTGFVTIYLTSSGATPQIVLESPTNIEIISDQEAQNRLAEKPNEVIETARPAVIQEPSRQASKKIPLSTVNVQSVNRSSANQGQSVKESKAKTTQSSISPLGQPIEKADKLNRLYLDSNKYSQPNPGGGLLAETKPQKTQKKKRFFERINEWLNKLLTG